MDLHGKTSICVLSMENLCKRKWRNCWCLERIHPFSLTGIWLPGLEASFNCAAVWLGKLLGKSHQTQELLLSSGSHPWSLPELHGSYDHAWPRTPLIQPRTLTRRLSFPSGSHTSLLSVGLADNTASWLKQVTVTCLLAPQALQDCPCAGKTPALPSCPEPTSFRTQQSLPLLLTGKSHQENAFITSTLALPKPPVYATETSRTSFRHWHVQKGIRSVWLPAYPEQNRTVPSYTLQIENYQEASSKSIICQVQDRAWKEPRNALWKEPRNAL